MIEKFKTDLEDIENAKEDRIVHKASKSTSTLIKVKIKMDEVERIEKKLKIADKIISEFWEYYD